MGKIKFGTDGWRAVVADEFTFANVRLVAQALALYLKETGGAGRGVVVAYDTRFLAERFAAAAAEVLAGNGLAVWLAGQPSPTPVAAFAVKDLGAAGAVMVTASHNPPEYCGIKFIPEYAGPATTEITAAIEEKLAAVEGNGVSVLPLAEGRKRGLVRELEARPSYLAHLRKLLEVAPLRKRRLRVVVDPLWGAGSGYLEELLGDWCDLEVIHGYRDVLFGGMVPEPREEVLGELAATVRAREADLGLALDGDADRFGVVGRGGRFFAPNEILSLLLSYLLDYRGWRGPVARTVATTHALDLIAGAHGLPVIETPVGFKYIAQSLLTDGSILGGEESGGLSVKGHVPEKDGILAACLVAEMVAATGMPLEAYQEEVARRYGHLVSTRRDLRYSPERRAELLARLAGWAPAALGGVPVKERLTRDGVKLLLDDGSWVLVRPSGTEPVFRVYAEAPEEARLGLLVSEACRVLGL